MKRFRIFLALASALVCICAYPSEPKVKVNPPDLEKIKKESTNEKSRYYYPRLLKQFMSNDTVMQNDQFIYFYYGTLFQEDFDPYREPFDTARLSKIEPLYYKTQHTKDEEKAMLRYAEEALQDNPLDLVQLKNKIYVHEKQHKDNLAKIWKNKLNHLLYVIASSGTGRSKDSPWIVVYPRHEFDVFNISGAKVQSQTYEFPHHDHLTVGKDASSAEDYYFDLGPLLEQYYLKHPTEGDFYFGADEETSSPEDAAPADTDSPSDTDNPSGDAQQ